MIRHLKTNWLAHLYSLSIVVVFGSGLLVLAMLFDPRDPPVRVDYSYPVAVEANAKSRAEIVPSPPVKQGEVFYTYREFCITAPYTILRSERWLVPVSPKLKSVPLPLLPSRIASSVVCETTSFANEIPFDAVPGEEYDYELRWSYQLKSNLLATFHYNWPSIRVKVAQ